MADAANPFDWYVTPEAFEAAHPYLLVAEKQNYDAAGNLAGALDLALIPSKLTAEYCNRAIDNFVLDWQRNFARFMRWGDGAPDMAAPIGSHYSDTETGILYANSTGLSDGWRAIGQGGTALQSSDITLSAQWGSTRAVSVAAGSTFMRGQMTITPGGTGITTGATVIVIDPDAPRPSGSFTQVLRNGGVDQNILGPGWNFTVTDASDRFTITVDAAIPPTTGETVILRWSRG